MKLQIIIFSCYSLLIFDRIIEATKLLSKKRSGRENLSFVCKFKYDINDQISWFVNNKKVENDHEFFRIKSSTRPNAKKTKSKLKILRPEVLFHDVHIRCQLNEVSYRFPVFIGLVNDNNGVYKYSLDFLYNKKSHTKIRRRAKKICKKWNAVLYGCKKYGNECGCDVKVFEAIDVKKVNTSKGNSVISVKVKDNSYSYENFQYNLTLWKNDNTDTSFYVNRINTTDIIIDENLAGYQIEPNTVYQVFIQYSSPYWQQRPYNHHTHMLYNMTATSSKEDRNDN